MYQQKNGQQPLIDKVLAKERKYNILKVILTILALVILVGYIGWRFDQAINQIKIENEKTQKGIICTLLILPANRTKENVTDCVNNNRTETDNKFQLNPPAESPPPTNQSITIPSPIPQAPPVIVPEPPKPQPTPTADLSPCPILRPILYVVDPDGRRLFKCTGDTNWQVL